MCLTRVQGTERSAQEKPALSPCVNELGPEESSLIFPKSTGMSYVETAAFHPYHPITSLMCYHISD